MDYPSLKTKSFPPENWWDWKMKLPFLLKIVSFAEEKKHFIFFWEYTLENERLEPKKLTQPLEIRKIIWSIHLHDFLGSKC